VPPIWTPDLVDEIQLVSTAEAKTMTRRLAKEEALFCGTSSGTNVIAAIRLAQRVGPGCTVGTLACDTGLKYLSTDLFAVV
jgi:cysteine synthase